MNISIWWGDKSECQVLSGEEFLQYCVGNLRFYVMGFPVARVKNSQLVSGRSLM